MRSLSFSELPGADVCVSSISSVERWWKNGNVNDYPEGRSENILSYTIHGRKELYSDGGLPVASSDKPAVFFIAAGVPYASKTILESDDDLGHTICIKFRFVGEMGEDVSISDRFLFWDVSSNEKIQKLFEKVYQLFLNAKIDQLRLKSVVYSIISELSASLTDTDKYRGFEDLIPALQYINSNYSKNITTEELSKLCYMSNSYFRKRFKDFTGGESFTEYRNKLRIQKAVELLDNPMWTINSIVQVLGFYDSSHFYRIYKKYTGKPPSKHTV